MKILYSCETITNVREFSSTSRNNTFVNLSLGADELLYVSIIAYCRGHRFRIRIVLLIVALRIRASLR